MERRLSKSEVVDAFVESDEVILFTRMWAKGAISDNELIEGFKSIHTAIDMNPVPDEEENFTGLEAS